MLPSVSCVIPVYNGKRDLERAVPRWPAIVNSTIWNVVMRKVVYQAVGGSPSGPAFRTRVSADGRFEFTEKTAAEGDGALREALGAYQSAAADNMAVLRNIAAATAQPAGVIDRLMRKLTGA